MDTTVFLTTNVQPNSGIAQRLLRTLGNRFNAENAAIGGAAALGLGAFGQ